jgi:hypothetical protein
MTRNPLTSEEWALLRASVQQSTADDTKKKWGQGRVSKPAEEAVNRWVAQQLISDDEWMRMEQTCPGDLRRMAEVLELPVAAVIWRARSVEHAGPGCKVELTPEALSLLTKPATGSGGIQSLLRSLQANLEDSWLTLQRKQFERLREYLVNLGGGGRARLQAVMDCVLAAVSRAGGLQEFFGDTAVKEPPAPAKSTRKSATAAPKAPPAKKKAAAKKAPPPATARKTPAKKATAAAEAPPKKASSAQAASPPKSAEPAKTSSTIQWKLPVSRGKT